MSSPRIAKHYTRIISLWPKDVLRPTVAFQNTLQYRASQFLPAKTSPVEPGSEPKAAATPGSSSAASLDPKAELLNINALYSLLENRYSKRYPTSPALLRPTSNPTYYEDLMVELEQAPGRSWFSRAVKRWKGLIRFS
jgi:cytochrome b pre-mRNA-processing protein 6